MTNLAVLKKSIMPRASNTEISRPSAKKTDGSVGSAASPLNSRPKASVLAAHFIEALLRFVIPLNTER